MEHPRTVRRLGLSPARRRGSIAPRMVRLSMIAIAAALGFYSGHAAPGLTIMEPLDAIPGLPPAPGGPPTAASGFPTAPQAAAPPSPLDFLREGLAERPTTVAALVAEVKLVAERLLERFPNQPDALEITGRLYFRLGDSQQATQAWQQCIELNADYGYAYDGLAMVAKKKGQFDEAARLFREALERNPERHETQIELAMVLNDANRLDEVVALLEKNVETDPRPYRGRVLLGATFLQQEKYEQAKENYELAIAAHPAHATAHLGLAQALHGLGEQERAGEYVAKYRELLASETELAVREREEFDDLETMCIDVAGTYFDAATICFSRGVLTDAEVLSLRAGVLDPKNVECRQALAYIYLQINQPLETIRVLEELTTIEPQNPVYPVEIARLYVGLGRLQPAEQTLKRIAEAAGAEAVADVAGSLAEQAGEAPHFVVLSIARQLNGDTAGALAAIDRALQLEPNRADFQQRKAALSSAN